MSFHYLLPEAVYPPILSSSTIDNGCTICFCCLAKQILCCPCNTQNRQIFIPSPYRRNHPLKTSFESIRRRSRKPFDLFSNTHQNAAFRSSERSARSEKKVAVVHLFTVLIEIGNGGQDGHAHHERRSCHSDPQGGRSTSRDVLFNGQGPVCEPLNKSSYPSSIAVPIILPQGSDSAFAPR